MRRIITSEGVSLNLEGRACHTGCDVEISRPLDFKNSKVNVIFKDASTLISGFTNLHETGIRRSKRLQKENTTYDGDDIVCSMFKNFRTEMYTSSSAPKSMSETILHAQEKSSSLIDSAINQDSECLLSSIANDVYNLRRCCVKLTDLNLSRQ